MKFDTSFPRLKFFLHSAAAEDDTIDWFSLRDNLEGNRAALMKHICLDGIHVLYFTIDSRDHSGCETLL